MSAWAARRDDVTTIGPSRRKLVSHIAYSMKIGLVGLGMNTDEPISVSEDMTLRSVAAVLGASDIGVVLVRRADQPRDLFRA